MVSGAANTSTMNRIIHILLFFTICSTSFGQFIDNQRFGLYDDYHPFSKKYIVDNEVQTVHCTRVLKPDGQPIVDQGLMTHWEFNGSGQLVKKFSSFVLGDNTLDTTAVFLTYDLNGNIVTERVSDGDGYYAYYSDYDSLGNKTHMKYTRETSSASSKMEFEMSKRYDIHDESYQYEMKEGQLISMTTFNAQNRPFLKTSYIYDSLGYLVEINERYIITRKTSVKKYTYDHHGRIGEETEQKAFGDGLPRKWVYSYDKVGNMTEAQYYVGEELRTTIQYMYDKKSLLVDAELVKDELSQAIEIRRFSYRFLNEAQ